MEAKRSTRQMIPLKLELTNFLSYRDTAVLEFEGIHLACISGANGAGKSSILDAITWSLFGRSRSKSDDDLVNRVAAMTGEDAEVKLTFSLEGGVYRAIRRRSPGKRLILELQMEAGPDQWRSLTESGSRETQGVIEALLRMNYDTFINASFLLQGKADEFTTKTPGRRKEILAELLGVNQWDRYKEAAGERRKQAEVSLTLLDGQVEEIDDELSQEDERKAALAQAEEELKEIELRVADKETLLQQMRRTEVAIKQQAQMVKNLAANLATAASSLDGFRRTFEQRKQERDAYQGVLASADEIAAEYAAWLKAEEIVKGWQAKADTHYRLQQMIRPHELRIAQERSRLEQRQRELTDQAERVEAARSERHVVEVALKEGRPRLQEIDGRLATLKQQEKAWHEARAEVQRLEGERQLLVQEQSQLQGQARRAGAAVEERIAVQANAQEADAQLAQLTQQIAHVSEQQEQYINARADLDSMNSEQPRLREQMDKLKKDRIEPLEKETGGDCPLCGQPLTEEHKQRVLEELRAEGKEAGDRYRTNKERISELTEIVSRLEEDIKQASRLEQDQRVQQQRLARAEARLAEIDQIVTEWESGRGPARLTDIEEKLSDESALAALKERIVELETAVQEIASLEAERETQQRQISASEARLAEVQRTVDAWEATGRDELDLVGRSLEQKAYAQESQEAVVQLHAESEALAYDESVHQAARQEQDALSHAPSRQQELKQAEAAVKPLEASLADLEKQIASQERIVSDLQQQHDAASQELEVISADGGDMEGVEDEVFRLREEKAAVDRRLGAAQQKLDVLDDLRERRQQLNGQRGEITTLVRRLKLLEQACGRDGVQALLIEHALPEIEDRANELLARLTGGEMRVSFETQKQLKSREETVETLEIRIVDNAGERPYANFSGGEQFRVNFAIRLALSQVLANRAGARLQTLVVDEGFGSQDPEGRQRLVEAINTIQEDFSRILVITHIDELRDAFPTRIQVEKTVTGSKLEIL